MLGGIIGISIIILACAIFFYCAAKEYKQKFDKD